MRQGSTAEHSAGAWERLTRSGYAVWHKRQAPAARPVPGSQLASREAQPGRPRRVWV